MALERLKLDGKVAIVTGAGRGVGHGIARVLAEAGAAIVATARTADQVEETAQEIRASGGQALALAGDVTRREDNARTIEAAMDSFGRIDIVINNAGAGGMKPFFDLTLDDLESNYRLNAGSTFMLTQLAAPHMLAQGSGSVVNISSLAARFGVRGQTVYCAAKAGVEQLTRAMAHELSPKIRVNAIALGFIMTSALERGFEKNPAQRDRLSAMVPLRRLGDPEDIGLAALYLCSTGCYATGTIVHIDGGMQQRIDYIDVPDL